MSKFSLLLTYSTCKNAIKKTTIKKIDVCQLNNILSTTQHMNNAVYAHRSSQIKSLSSSSLSSQAYISITGCTLLLMILLLLREYRGGGGVCGGRQEEIYVKSTFQKTASFIVVQSNFYRAHTLHPARCVLFPSHFFTKSQCMAHHPPHFNIIIPSTPGLRRDLFTSDFFTKTLYKPRPTTHINIIHQSTTASPKCSVSFIFLHQNTLQA